MKWTKWNVTYITLGAVFVVFMIFFAPASIIKRIRLHQEQKSLDNQINHYDKEIEETKKRLYELTENDTTLERYAREVYQMQAADETVYIIEETEE